jgi:hypothetical protein
VLSRLGFLSWKPRQRMVGAGLLLALAGVVAYRARDVEAGLGPALFGVAVAVPWARLRARSTRRTRRRTVAPILAGATLLAALLAALVTAVTTDGSLSPLVGNTLYAAGFTLSGLHPRSIAVDGVTTGVLVFASLAGAMGLVVGLVERLGQSRIETRTPVSMRLLALSAIGVLVVTIGYGPIGGPVNGLYDRYLLPVLPGMLGLVAFAARERRSAVPVLLAGVVVCASWSISWQREYMERQAAVWTVAETLVDQGIPAAEIDAGYEWNGWTRGDAVIERARQEAVAAGEPRRFVQLVVDGLYAPHQWHVGFGPLGRGCSGRPLVEVGYGSGWTAYGLQRCRPPP